MSKRDTIAALLRKAGDKGATEAEAAEAMRLAQRLANSEGLSIADIEADNAEAHDFLRRDIKSEKPYLHPIDSRLRSAISRFTCTKAYAAHEDEKGNRGRYVVFFGHAADIELALYIRDTCIRASENSWWVYRRMQLSGRRNVDIKAERFTFFAAFCNLMKERMDEYTRVDAKARGTDLIVLKNQLVTTRFAEYCADKGIGVVSEGQPKYRNIAAGAVAAGTAAAQAVDLGRGVASRAPKMIGKG